MANVEAEKNIHSFIHSLTYSSFQAVNIRVLNIPKTNHLLLEIVFGKQEHIENMQRFCSSKKINIMFEECFRSLKTETDLQFTFCVNYQNENPDDAASLADNG